MQTIKLTVLRRLFYAARWMPSAPGALLPGAGHEAGHVPVAPLVPSRRCRRCKKLSSASGISCTAAKSPAGRGSIPRSPAGRSWELVLGRRCTHGHVPLPGAGVPSPGPSCRRSALWPSSREALKSISLFKYRKCFENTESRWIRRFEDQKQPRGRCARAWLTGLLQPQGVLSTLRAPRHPGQRRHCFPSLLPSSSSLSRRQTPSAAGGWLSLCRALRGLIEELSSACHFLPMKVLSHCNQAGTSSPFD